MTYEEIVSRVADNMGVTMRLVDKTYKAYWKAIREHIMSLPLTKDLSDEEFKKLQPNVNIPSLGKLNVTLDRYHGMLKQKEIKQQIKLKYKKDNSNVGNL